MDEISPSKSESTTTATTITSSQYLNLRIASLI